MIYYIADTHFGDERILRLANRPFKSITEMDDTIIKNWNEVVSCNDTIYIIGDFAFNDMCAKDIIGKLNGHKILILGNHDDVLSNETLDEFEKVDKLLTIRDNNRSVCLCHYPLLSFEKSIYGGYHVFGHIHNNQNDIAFILEKQINNIFNAGVDVINFKPRTLDELIKLKEVEYDL